jgi:hypothetical protein
LGFATVGADIGFQVNPEIKSTPKSGDAVIQDKGGIAFGLGAWIEKGLGNGSIKTGVGVQLPTDIHKPEVGDAVKNDLVLTIPVILEYTF